MSTARARPVARRRALSLAAKKQPAQQRAAETVERILEATAAALADIGFERLSTNIVCARAGLTPPALYRYFPNKYALLYELGRRLMQRQNALVPHWITPQALRGSAAELERAIAGLLIDTRRVTAETLGGMWIIRALRAVPALQTVRLDSHAEVTAAQTALLVETYPRADPQELRMIGRVAVEMIYAAVEMLFDEPLDEAAVARVVASMIASQLSHVQGGTE
jgi:AcrR family transcriptional regulator